MAKYCSLKKRSDRPTGQQRASTADGKHFKIFKSIFCRAIALPRCRTNDGFTLVEMLVATTVLAIGLLGVIGMQLYAINGNSYSWNLSLAENIAQQRIEYMKNVSYNTCKVAHFNTGGFLASGQPAPYATALAAGVITAADEIPTGGDFSCAPYTAPCASDTYNQYLIDSEGYGGLMNAPNNSPYGGSPLSAPYTNFRRVTIEKVIDGYYFNDPSGHTPEDCMMIVKVIVYWQDVNGVQHKVSEMTEKALGT